MWLCHTKLVKRIEIIRNIIICYNILREVRGKNWSTLRQFNAGTQPILHIFLRSSIKAFRKLTSCSHSCYSKTSVGSAIIIVLLTTPTLSSPPIKTANLLWSSIETFSTLSFTDLHKVICGRSFHPFFFRVTALLRLPSLLSLPITL